MIMHSLGILGKQKEIMKCQINLDTITLLGSQKLMGDVFKFNTHTLERARQLEKNSMKRAFQSWFHDQSPDLIIRIL